MAKLKNIAFFLVLFIFVVLLTFFFIVKYKDTKALSSINEFRTKLKIDNQEVIHFSYYSDIMYRRGTVVYYYTTEDITTIKQKILNIFNTLPGDLDEKAIFTDINMGSKHKITTHGPYDPNNPIPIGPRSYKWMVTDSDQKSWVFGFYDFRNFNQKCRLDGKEIDNNVFSIYFQTKP